MIDFCWTWSFWSLLQRGLFLIIHAGIFLQRWQWTRISAPNFLELREVWILTHTLQLEISWRHILYLHIYRGNKAILKALRRKATQVSSRESQLGECCLRMGTGFCLHNSQTNKNCHMFCWAPLSLPPFVRKLKPISLLVPWNLSESW